MALNNESANRDRLGTQVTEPQAALGAVSSIWNIVTLSLGTKSTRPQAALAFLSSTWNIVTLRNLRRSTRNIPAFVVNLFVRVYYFTNSVYTDYVLCRIYACKKVNVYIPKHCAFYSVNMHTMYFRIFINQRS